MSPIENVGFQNQTKVEGLNKEAMGFQMIIVGLEGDTVPTWEARSNLGGDLAVRSVPTCAAT